MTTAINKIVKALETYSVDEDGHDVYAIAQEIVAELGLQTEWGSGHGSKPNQTGWEETALRRFRENAAFKNDYRIFQRFTTPWVAE